MPFSQKNVANRSFLVPIFVRIARSFLSEWSKTRPARGNIKAVITVEHTQPNYNEHIIPLEEKGFPCGKEHYQFSATHGYLTCNHEVLMTNSFSQSPTE